VEVEGGESAVVKVFGESMAKHKKISMVVTWR